MTHGLMVQGTGSDVGKSLVVAGLARAFTQRGLSVRPFKPQNMSNNAAVTIDGGEIGRAQALQALACRIQPTVHMNPVLLKPETNSGAQIIVRGQRVASMSAREYMSKRKNYLSTILDSFNSLRNEADIVLVEGAGSPAEINLREHDIANMGFAHAANLSVILVGDIHRGGVIASIIGTLAVISDQDRQRIRSFLINNFRGDPSLFDDGVTYLNQQTGLPCSGIIPYFEDAARLPSEDAVALDHSKDNGEGSINIAVPRLSRIANFDDLDPLKLEPDVNVLFVQPGQPIPADADLIFLPGTKSTIGDLKYIRSQGWDIDIHAHVRRGGHLLGICGGYQMLGKTIHDPDGIEGPPESIDGLGLLDIDTTISMDKKLTKTSAVHLESGQEMNGYEIHLGKTTGPDTRRPFAEIGAQPDGAVSPNGRIQGTYLHGIFSSDGFRRSYLGKFSENPSSKLKYMEEVDMVLDKLANHLEKSANLDLLLEIASSGNLSGAKRAHA